MQPTLRTSDLDRNVLDTLKDVHNRGAELYNAGDHVGAFRLYEGGLIVAKPFLAHRARQQEAIREGLEQIEKSNAEPKLKAFRLHEVIEQIRTELKGDIKKHADSLQPAEVALSGRVTLSGMAIGGIAIAIYPVTAKLAIATTKSDSSGAYQVATTLPVGSYLVTLVGDEIPANYHKPETTPLRIELKNGVNHFTLEVK